MKIDSKEHQLPKLEKFQQATLYVIIADTVVPPRVGEGCLKTACFAPGLAPIWQHAHAPASFHWLFFSGTVPPEGTDLPQVSNSIRPGAG